MNWRISRAKSLHACNGSGSFGACERQDALEQVHRRHIRRCVQQRDRRQNRVDPATVGRWRTGAVDPKPRQVVAYARAYGQSPIGALIAAGYLSEGEVDIPVTSPRAYTLDDFSPLELAEEVVRRLAEEDRAAGEGEILPFKPTGRGGDVGGASEDAPQYRPDIAASDDDGWESRQEDENESP